MPTKDPKTGRPLSGAAKRALAAARQGAPEPEAPSPAQRFAEREKKRTKATAKPPAATGQELPPNRPDGAYGELEPPPLGKPEQAIAWANDVVLVAMDQVVRDVGLKAAERWRWIKDFAAVLGMLRDKSAEQVAIKRILAKQTQDEKSQGTVSADGRSKASIPKPAS